MKNLSDNTSKKCNIKKLYNTDYCKAYSISEKNYLTSIVSAIKIGSVFAGAVLGAGFAGGKELVIFFVRYGEKGVMASLLAGILFLIFGTAIIYKSKATSTENYSSYLRHILPKPIAISTGIITDLFLLVCFIIMLSGAGALFKECFHLPAYIGSIATAFIVFLVLKGGIKSIGSICSILTPIMVIGIVTIDIFAIYTDTTSVFASGINANNTVLLPSLLYVSYNMLSSAPVLCGASALAPNRKTAVLGATVGGVFLTTIAFMSCLALSLTNSEILEAELPLLVLSSKFCSYFNIFYAFILYMAILTTAFSTGFPLIKKTERYISSASTSSLLLCIGAIPLSFLRFSVLVERCYIFFGILGLILITAIFYNLIKSAKNLVFRRKT